MQLNYLAIVLATIAQFAVGAVWYSVLFGKLWGKIHGFDKLPKDVQQEMMKQMGPFYGLQALVTLITSVVLAMVVVDAPFGWSPFVTAFFLWLGFVVPTQVSAVIFGGTEGKWIAKKIAVQAGASLACLMAAAVVFTLFA